MKQFTLFATLALTIFTFYGCANKAYADGYGATKTTEAAKANSVVIKADTTVGEVFATTDGMTLYIFKKDGKATSNCYDGCAASWPPFMAKKNSKTWGDFSVIKRKDDTYQWAYMNQPLYTWVGDRNLGDINGHGVGDVWYAAQTAK